MPINTHLIFITSHFNKQRFRKDSIDKWTTYYCSKTNLPTSNQVFQITDRIFLLISGTRIKLLFNCDIHEHTPEPISTIMCYQVPGVWVKRGAPTLLWYGPESLKDIRTRSNFNEHVKRYLFSQRLGWPLFWVFSNFYAPRGSYGSK